MAGRDLTQLDGQRLDRARLASIWQQVVALRKARIAHHDLSLVSIMVDQQGQGWLVDFDRAEAAATDQLLDRDLTTLLAALDVADPALVHATAEQALGLDTMARVLPLAAATPAPPATPPKDPNRPGSPSDPPNTSLTSRLQPRFLTTSGLTVGRRRAAILHPPVPRPRDPT